MAPKRKRAKEPVPEPAPEAIEALEEAPEEAPEAVEESPPAEEAVSIPPAEPDLVQVAPESVPEGMATTYSGPADPPEQPATPQIERVGQPLEYMVLRVANKGWVIEEKWQRIISFDAIQAIIDAEIEAGRSGTLYRGNRVVFSWGDEAPARV